MKLIDSGKKIFQIHIISNDLIFQFENQLVNLNNSKIVDASYLTTAVYNNTIYTRTNSFIMVYTSKLNILNSIEIENSNGVYFVDLDRLLIASKYENSKSTIIYFDKQKKIKEEYEFFGKFLNERYRINFPSSVFIKPKKFAFYDYNNNATLWNYNSIENYQAKNLWIIRGEYFIFCEHQKGYFAGRIIKVHLLTGEIKWNADIPYTDFQYNEEQGILVSFWGGEHNGKNYQIVNIDNETVENGEPLSNCELANVNTYGDIQYIHNRKLYFVDNVFSFSGQLANPIKFGCFDLDSKKIDFVQEVPEAAGSQFAQIKHHENKLYLRTVDNRLFIFEDEWK